MARTQPLLLIHERTKQRYPLRGDFVIGRSTGDLVFDQDPKLSGKHCLIRSTSGGTAIYDLKSRTGIQINGVPLPGGKACVLKAGLRVTLGDQSFAVNEDKRAAQEIELEGAGDQRTLVLSLAPLVLVAMVAAGYFWPPARHAAKPAEVRVTSGDPNAELASLINRFDRLGLVRGRAPTTGQLQILRDGVVPEFESLHNRFQTLAAPTYDRNRRLSGAYFGLASAILASANLTTDEPTTTDTRAEIEQFEREIKILRSEARAD